MLQRGLLGCVGEGLHLRAVGWGRPPWRNQTCIQFRNGVVTLIEAMIVSNQRRRALGAPVSVGQRTNLAEAGCEARSAALKDLREATGGGFRIVMAHFYLRHGTPVSI